jgi:hypothetical protein
VGYDSTLGNPLGDGFDRVSALFGRATVRYYPTPNTRLEVTGLFASGTVDFTYSGPNLDFEAWLVRGKIEHKFGHSPFAIFAAYDWSQHKFNDANINSSRVTESKFTVGIRLGINEHSLQSDDSKGTTLDIIDLGTLYRIAGGLHQ